MTRESNRLFFLLLAVFGAVACASSPKGTDGEDPKTDVSIWSDPVDTGEMRKGRGVPLRDNQAPEADPETGETKKKDGEWLAAPIPFANPTIGAGLGLFSGYIFPIDPEETESPPSTIGLGGFYSSNGSLGVFGGMKGYLAEDTWRFKSGLFYASLNVDFYGIGHEAGEKGDRIRLNQEAYGGLVEVTRFLGWDSYLGPRVQAWWVETTFRDDNPLVEFVPDDLLNQQIVGLGAQFQRDTRDDVHYPTDGMLIEVTYDAFNEAWGSDENYEVWENAINHYLGIADKTVLASRLFGRFTFGDVPYFGLSQIGMKSDLRGYNAGQYRDRMLLAGQMEVRHFFADRFGAVVFGGLGAVAPGMTEWDSDEILPSIGAGLRYTIAPENNVNFRLDVAWGSEGWAFYFGVGEAF